jgi:phosphatidylserine/phosphatidylglycerophosphate/cardiolipin synthase-like enzyme
MMKKYFLLNFLFLAVIFLNAQTIAEIQGNADDSPYNGQSVTTSGIVTAINNISYYIQDGMSVRSGLYIYDDTNSPAVGDSIEISGTIDEYFNLTELVDVTNLTLISSGNSLPSPIELSTGDVNDEDYESMLVIVSGECTNSDLGFGEWELDDGSGTCRVDDLLQSFAPTQGVDYEVTGPLHYSFDNFKIEPRNVGDIVIDLPLYFTINPSEKDITTSSLTVYWETNIASNTVLEYGLTPALELGTLMDATMTTEHEVLIESLSPGTIYFVKPYSQSGIDETPTSTLVMATQSNSSGKIKAYFNHEVNHSVATISNAVYTESIVDTIISYLDLSQNTLDITMYEAENQEIVDAINAAYDRGVVVRVISDDIGNNAIFDNLNVAIPLLKGNTVGIMHNKFIIIDRDDVENSWVMTGSMNHTIANLGWDFNNVICIQDQSLARAYTLEFNEMWGTNEAQPDENNAKFSNQKTDNTPHKFNLNGTAAELYFSPSDNATAHIVSAIDAAEEDLAFAVLVFTENTLGNAVLDAHNRGVNAAGIIDYVEFNGSEFDFLLNNGVNVMDYQNEDGTQWPDGPTLHHKYAIIDYETGSENPLLITGSHNWTASAESIHDENTLFIYDAEVANWYYQEFHARFFGVVATKELPFVDNLIKAYPNPVENILQLQVSEKGILQIFDLLGRKILEEKVGEGSETLEVGQLTSGTYFLKYYNKNSQQILKIVKE